jgi:hypothetical protein
MRTSVMMKVLDAIVLDGLFVLSIIIQ